MQINSASDIQTRIERAREEYPALWRRFIQEWREAESVNTAWLMYAANYIFSTGGVRWAMDPLSLSTRISGVDQPNFLTDLDVLELVLFTHSHHDHFDSKLVGALAGSPIKWIVPEDMRGLAADAGIPGKNILIPEPGRLIYFKGLRITPFTGQHIHGRYGVPETSYLVECGKKRWLFPGDTRVYDPNHLPDFGVVDAVFAHVWLGKKCAALPTPPLLDEFCQFFLVCNANRILLTHLEELGRDERDFWDSRHVELIRQKMKELGVADRIEKYITGQKIVL